MTSEYSECIAAARAELSLARQLLTDEIRSYPSPVSGCDAQYNHLLAERRKVLDALAKLKAEIFIPTPRMPFAGAQVESR